MGLECLHYWVLASQAAEGTCKHCGISRQFDGGDIRDVPEGASDRLRPLSRTPGRRPLGGVAPRHEDDFRT